MKSNRNIVYFFKSISKKHRLSLRDQHNDSEVWYMHISPIKVIGGVLALVLILFIIILTAIAYTPVLDLIPGYKGNKQREMLIQNIMRLDSIERRVNELQVYGENVALIMDGKTPSMRNVTQIGDTIKVTRPEPVQPSAADSMLRRQMEGSGIYGLKNTQVGRVVGNELITPVRGVAASHFSPKDNRFGVGIATAANIEVLSVAEGSIIFSAWTPGEGHTVQIQHAGNLVSTYRNLSQTLLPVGARVKGGEAVGYTGEGITGEGGKGLLELELWQNGSPMDPENYIVF